MKYVSLGATIGGISGVIDPDAYLRRLPALASDLPPGARGFATSRWATRPRPGVT
jgi:hypothetical protein